MEAHNACSPPLNILGLTIRSRTRIYVSYIIPNILELLIYIVQIVADCAVSYQHFKSKQTDFGWATLSLILVPPFVSCILVLSSKSQWIKENRNGTRVKFVLMQLLQMISFPFFVVYRSTKLVFWSIEALFHGDDDVERMACLEKAEECSTCELYHLVQAYGQSAPQIILQLYHMLTQDLFRNFKTTKVQTISLVFSAIDLASITAIYQRFESQRQVGRHYPWSTEEQKRQNRLKIEKNKYLQEECKQRKRDSERTLNKFPESDKIMENFKARNPDKAQAKREYANTQADSPASVGQLSETVTHTVEVHAYDEIDNEAQNEQIALLATHLTDDDKIKTNPFLQLGVKHRPPSLEELDQVPNMSPPLPPKIDRVFLDTNLIDSPQIRNQTSTHSSNENHKRRSKTISQLEIFRQMMLMNVQLYIKEKMPRPPKMLIKRVEDTKNSDKRGSQSQSPRTHQDEIDFFMPRPTKVINGIQQDDFAAKTIAFFGWMAFIIMRMLSLAAFCVFFPKTFLIIIGTHYLIMLIGLYLESRFKGKLNRTFFYLLLAYVYIYVLLEFRVKFKHIRVWFVVYFLISITENLSMTIVWYTREEFESWWFGFIFQSIIYSGIISVATIIVYYFILKPNNVVLLVEDENVKQPPAIVMAATA